MVDYVFRFNKHVNDIHLSLSQVSSMSSSLVTCVIWEYEFMCWHCILWYSRSRHLCVTNDIHYFSNFVPSWFEPFFFFLFHSLLPFFFIHFLYIFCHYYKSSWIKLKPFVIRLWYVVSFKHTSIINSHFALKFWWILNEACSVSMSNQTKIKPFTIVIDVIDALSTIDQNMFFCLKGIFCMYLLFLVCKYESLKVITSPFCDEYQTQGDSHHVWFHHFNQLSNTRTSRLFTTITTTI